MANSYLKIRTKEYALSVIRLFAALPRRIETQILGRQLLRAGTSVGAQYREATRAKSNAALRTGAGLSQRQLAKMIGTTASVICRLEDADYEGHSLAMLNRIATALNRRVEIHFVSAERRLRTAYQAEKKVISTF